jgi:hypothetical protein
MRGAPSGNKTPNNEIERDRYLQPKDQDKKLNPPSRHLPLALQLIVEQTHMNDVLVTLANSRLRFQITQVEFHHVPDYTPQSDGDKKGGSDMAGAGDRTFMGGMPGMYGSMRGSGMQMEMQRRQRQQSSDYEAMMRRQMQQQQMQRGGMMMPAAPPGGSMAAGSMGSSLNRPGGGRTGSGYPGMPGGSAPDKSATTPQDDNLVELTIYGIATLYRSPDAPQTTDQPGQPGSQPSPTAPQSPVAAPPAQPAPQASQQTEPKTPAPQAGQQPTAPAPSTTNPPKTDNPPSAGSNSPPPAPKQPDKPADSPKTPPPAVPPAGNKK